MNKLVEFLVHSNIYLAIGAGLVAIMIIILLQMPFRWEPIFIAFCGTFFLYNLNRITDIKEDRINYPSRTRFTEKYGKKLIKISSIFYFTALFIAFANNLLTGFLALLPFILVFLYSVLRAKKIFLIKDLIVGIGWSLIVFLVASYYNFSDLFYFVFFLSIFIFFRVLITTIVFDIKDIKGDKIYKISTIPVKYGIKFTKNILYCINFICILLLFVIPFFVSVPSSFYYLFFLIIYSFVYITLIRENNIKFVCDILADGEYIFIGIIMILVYIFGL
ncbi:MAG: UbiA family prenyltransferase [Candidatus Aenigmatarchaeota archaeon]